MAVVRNSASPSRGETGLASLCDRGGYQSHRASRTDRPRSAWPYASLPRFLRPPAAAAYLAMNKNSFKRLVRPWVRAVPIGKRAIAFDRLALDAWAEEYSQCNGRPAHELEGRQWEREPCLDSTNRSVQTAASSGKSISESATMAAFARALAQATTLKRSGTSRDGSSRSARPRSSGSGPSAASERPPRST